MATATSMSGRGSTSLSLSDATPVVPRGASGWLFRLALVGLLVSTTQSIGSVESLVAVGTSLRYAFAFVLLLCVYVSVPRGASPDDDRAPALVWGAGAVVVAALVASLLAPRELQAAAVVNVVPLAMLMAFVAGLCMRWWRGGVDRTDMAILEHTMAVLLLVGVVGA